MEYEEDRRPCRTCGRDTWHGRDAPGVFRPRSLAVFSHLITVWTDLAVPWACLECGRKSRGRARLDG